MGFGVKKTGKHGCSFLLAIMFREIRLRVPTSGAPRSGVLSFGVHSSVQESKVCVLPAPV